MIDPEETWGSWFKRIFQFKEPPMVEIAEYNAKRQKDSSMKNKIIPKA